MQQCDSFIVSNKHIITIFKQWTTDRSPLPLSSMRHNLTITRKFSLPQEMANPTFYLNCVKAIIGNRIIMNLLDAIIMQHVITKFIQAFSSCKPTGRDNQRNLF